MKDKHANELLIESFFEAFSKCDHEKIKTILSANIKWHIPGNHQLSGIKQGIEEVLEFFEGIGGLGLKAESIVVGANDTCHRLPSQLVSFKRR